VHVVDCVELMAARSQVTEYSGVSSSRNGDLTPAAQIITPERMPSHLEDSIDSDDSPRSSWSQVSQVVLSSA